MRRPRKGRRVASFLGLGMAAVLVVSPWFFYGWLRGWYRLYREFERLSYNAQGYAEYRHRKTGIVFVLLPGGRFWMGSEPGDESEPEEWPRHEVVLTAFLIAKYEFRQSEWRSSLSGRQFTGADLPMTQLSWEACESFCGESGLKLPTEAQWEYACRAGSTGAFSGTGRLDEMGWHQRNAGGAPHAVGLRKPNAFGLYDMHGNVWELCRDVYDPTFYSWRKATGRDPVCTWGPGDRVRRGGSWRSSADGCRSAYRGSIDPTTVNVTVGFRPVWTFE